MRGSIPAHTGKPAVRLASPRSSTVYPRPHGEADERPRGGEHGAGLSPPTRGSLGHALGALVDARSIPAHTGKPEQQEKTSKQISVYPRPHGEARWDARGALAEDGLSPPTRGSHLARLDEQPRAGSIPAHTGKPLGVFPSTLKLPVYPRPHGEAVDNDITDILDQGLSPPTRGSRGPDLVQVGVVGSIPAHTGKPPASLSPSVFIWVYPRPHGEAAAPSSALACE